MPWSKKDYPPSMKNLPGAIRDKAVDIANALVSETDMDEGIIIATAISRAKDWGANRGMSIDSTDPDSKSTDVKHHGEDRYVIPSEDGKWAIKVEGRDRAEKIFSNKKEAVSRARKEARELNVSLTIQKKSGKVQQRISYNPNRRKQKSK
ncbi:MAG: hypothetical protein C0490_02750 [Marivirga sp.]|nr:hypothetical protein [Marivirga sp.]